MRGTYFGLCILLITCSTGEGHLTCTNDDSSFNSWLCGLNDWMESMKEWKHRIEQYCSEEDLGTEWKELFSCSDPITVSCCDDAMEHCDTNYFNCTICYCTDGKYTNRYRYQQLWKKHQTDFQTALRLYDEKLQNCRKSSECEENVAGTAQPTNETTDGVATKPTKPATDGVTTSPTNSTAGRLTITPTNAANQEMTTIKSHCPSSFDNGSFILYTERVVSYNEGVGICEDLGGHLANIYCQAHMDAVMNHTRGLGLNGTVRFRLGMIFDPLNNTIYLRDGSDGPADLQWAEGFPQTGTGSARQTTVTLDVNLNNSSSKMQFLYNDQPYLWGYLLCEIG